MKKMFIALMLMVSAACTFGKIEPGHVGVVVPLSGDEKGKLETTGNGWYMYSFNTQVYEFPTYNQNHNWTNAAGEGNKNVDERIYFMDRSGQKVGADVGIQFHVPPETVAQLFKTYRQDLDSVRDTVLKMEVRNALNLAAQEFTAEDMFGDKRSTFFSKALALVRESVGKNGLVVDNLYLNGELELPPAISETITAKLNATMIAQQKENEKRAVEAEAAKIVAKAEGDAKAVRAQADGQAAAQLSLARAQAESNRLIGNSLQTSGILELRKLEIQAEVQKAYAAQWQGQVPQQILPGQVGMLGFGLPAGK